MKAHIVDPQAPRAITPAALVAYARGEGWQHIEAYGSHSDVYAHANRPELVIPRTDRLADYPRVVAELIVILAATSGRDELALYHDLLGADRDVVRVRARVGADDGSVSLAAGVGLFESAREMLFRFITVAALAPVASGRDASTFPPAARLAAADLWRVSAGFPSPANDDLEGTI